MKATVTSLMPGNAADSGWFLAHWRGRLSLAGGFWWCFALPLVLLGAMAGALAAWIEVHGRGLPAVALALLFIWPLTLLALVWGGTGAWRAAGAKARSGTGLLWAGSARAGVVLGVLGMLAMLVMNALPQANAWLSLARGVDPIGAVQAQVTPDGRRLRLQGPLGLGAAASAAAALAGAPGVWLLELDSPGGRHTEAVAIAEWARSRRLQTRVVGTCRNACVHIFMAGRGRQVMPGGHVVLHRQRSGTANPLFDALALWWQAGEWRRAGLPDGVVTKALVASTAYPWVLESDELQAAGLVGRTDRPLDVELPPADGAPVGEYAEALTSNMAWRALDSYRPGAIATAAQAMVEARAKGADDAAAQVAAQRVVEALLPRLVRDAGPALREQYVELLQQQLQAAQAGGAATCRAVLAGDAAARYGLPAPWPAREASWLLDAAAEPAPAPPRPLLPLESEVLRRKLGDGAAGLLGSVRRLSRIDPWPSECARATALIAEVLQLPAPERRLALRVMFDR